MDWTYINYNHIPRQSIFFTHKKEKLGTKWSIKTKLTHINNIQLYLQKYVFFELKITSLNLHSLKIS